MAVTPDLFAPWLRRLSAVLHRLPQPMHLALGVALLALVAHADERSGPYVSLSMLYVLPIAQVTWYVSGWWGMLFSLFGGVAAYAFARHALPVSLTPWEHAWSLGVRVVQFALVAGLIWSLRRAVENQRSLANTDELTGIANARSFRAAAAREIARAQREGAPLTAVYLDCDNFKLVNDRQGHAGGDRLLRTVAATITNHLRLTDTASRLGGDEFGVLLPGLNASDAQSVVGKLQVRLLEQMRANRWPVTFSIGAVTFQNPPGSVEQLINQIDALQYQAKSTGKNRVRFAIEPQADARPNLAA
jgi:diguanylate cyclase (GGDEF)-like protein